LNLQDSFFSVKIEREMMDGKNNLFLQKLSIKSDACIFCYIGTLVIYIKNKGFFNYAI